MRLRSGRDCNSQVCLPQSSAALFSLLHFSQRPPEGRQSPASLSTRSNRRSRTSGELRALGRMEGSREIYRQLRSGSQYSKLPGMHGLARPRTGMTVSQSLLLLGPGGEMGWMMVFFSMIPEKETEAVA